MSRSASFDPSERLPWLSDPARPQPRQPRRSWLPLAFALSAAGAIAYGGWTMVERTSAPQPAPAVPAERVALPPPQAVAPSSATAPAETKPQPPTASEREALRPAATPAAKPTATKSDRQSSERQGRDSSANRTKQSATRSQPRSVQSAQVAAAPPRRMAAPTAQPRALWPSQQTAGAGGRLVQIGAFGTRQQAKLGWRRMQRSYPAVGRLPAVVVEARNSRGRKFYRFQIGTTSHAHSEVLCQRMQAISYSCAVMGLPWKAKVER